MFKSKELIKLFFYCSVILLIASITFLLKGQEKLAENGGNLLFLFFILVCLVRIVDYFRKSSD